MQAERTTAISAPAISRGVLVVSGYGVQVTVRRGHLAIEDGIGDERRRMQLHRATSGLRRLVILGHSGFVTLEALRWLQDIGGAFVQIDADGRLIAASGPVGLDDARLRRAQALTVTNGVGIKMARDLVRRKLEGQLAVLARLPDVQTSANTIRKTLACLDNSATPAQLRLLESTAAAAYWKSWEQVPVRFVRLDEPRVPDHWWTFGSRTSPLTGGPRLAANPANALLNYLYAILEGEARIAALTMGLDPGMGVLHADQPARDSLALDLLEAIRPEVDAFIVEMLQNQVFRASDFFETRQGVCRVLPALTHALAETATQWAKRIAPVAEWAAQTLASGPGSRIRQLPTPLTQARRSRGRDALRRRSRTATPEPPRPTLLHVCLTCGAELRSRRRSYCDDCLRAINAESLAALKTAGAAALAKLRAEGRDPTHGGDAARKRVASLARRRQEATEWERSNPRPEPDKFTRMILPSLRNVPLRVMMRATGLSLRYCSLIRRGLYVPHPRHWEALERVAIPR